MLIGYLYDYFARARSPQRFFTTNNVAFAARSFVDVGCFDVRAVGDTAEDRDLCDRWSRSGRTLVYEAEAVVYHHNPFTLGSFVRCHFNYGRGAVHFHRARARRGGARLRLEPLAFYTGMLAHPFRKERSSRASLRSALLALSQLAYGVGYALERIRTSASSRESPRL
jgi:GT2 family glycosyltransferase